MKLPTFGEVVSPTTKQGGTKATFHSAEGILKDISLSRSQVCGTTDHYGRLLDLGASVKEKTGRSSRLFRESPIPSHSKMWTTNESNTFKENLISGFVADERLWRNRSAMLQENRSGCEALGVCFEIENGRLVSELDVQLAKNKRLIVQTGLLTDKIQTEMGLGVHAQRRREKVEACFQEVASAVREKEDLVKQLKEQLASVVKRSIRTRLNIGRLEKEGLEASEELARLEGVRQVAADRSLMLLEKEQSLLRRTTHLKSEHASLLEELKRLQNQTSESEKKMAAVSRARASAQTDLAMATEETKQLTAELASMKTKVAQLEAEGSLMNQRIAALTNN